MGAPISKVTEVGKWDVGNCKSTKLFPGNYMVNLLTFQDLKAS